MNGSGSRIFVGRFSVALPCGERGDEVVATSWPAREDGWQSASVSATARRCVTLQGITGAGCVVYVAGDSWRSQRRMGSGPGLGRDPSSARLWNKHSHWLVPLMLSTR